MSSKIFAIPLFGEEDSPVTITGHSLRLNFKKTAVAFQEDEPQKKYHHQNPSRYIGRIRVANLDTNADYYEECERGCMFEFKYDDGGTTGTLTVKHEPLQPPSSGAPVKRITIVLDGIAFQSAGPPFVNDTGALQPDIKITDASGITHTLTIDNPANCQVVLSLKH